MALDPEVAKRAEPRIPDACPHPSIGSFELMGIKQVRLQMPEMERCTLTGLMFQ